MALLRLTVAIAVLFAGCSDSERVSPTAPTPSTVAVAPTPAPPIEPGVPPPFPPVSRPARVYVAAQFPTYEYHRGPLASRYVLYDDGAFGLQYASPRFGTFEYRGMYTESNGHLDFQWEGSSLAGPWGATAVITEESLTVSYNVIMQMTDFEDGVFLRVR